MGKDSKVDKEKMLELRLQYKTLLEISSEFDVTRSLIGIYLKDIYNNADFGLRYKLDEVRNYFRYKEKEKIDMNKISNYELGILWGIGSWIEEDRVFILRHRNKYFLEQIKKYTDSIIYEQKSRTGIQYVLKIFNFDINSLVNLGWSERNSEVRVMPVLDDYKDFLRVYIELHGCLDYSLRYKKKDKSVKYKGLRLRIYGNKGIVEDINRILSEKCGVGVKTIQGVKSNNKTFYVAYASFVEIDRIYNWIFDYPYCKEYWDEVEGKMREPVIWVW